MFVRTIVKNKVELVGWYGGDETHAHAAWTSTNRKRKYESDRHYKESCQQRIPALLKMLAENDHGTPFERSLLHFSVTCDTASHIHFLKHRMFSINGESARYREYTDDKFYIPVDWDEDSTRLLASISTEAYKTYHETIAYLERRGSRRRR